MDYKVYHSNPEIPTKSNNLVTIIKLYDPYGLFFLILFFAKLLIQLLWTQGLHWDEPIAIFYRMEHISGGIAPDWIPSHLQAFVFSKCYITVTWIQFKSSSSEKEF